MDLSQKKSAGKPIKEICENFNKLKTDLLVICNYNKVILRDLELRLDDWEQNSMLADIFLKMAGFLKTYTQYVTHYSKTQSVLTTYKLDQHVQATLESLKPANESRGIKSFLIMPVQHIPRLSLLLRDILKSTWKEHADYANLLKAAHRLDEIAEYVEVSQDVTANQNKVREIALALTNSGKKNAQV